MACRVKSPQISGLILAFSLLCLSGPASAYLLPKERQALELPYEVNDPDASYLDVAGRMQLLARTDDPLLRQAVNELQMGLSCRGLKARPVLDGVVTLPSFYDNPDEWSLTVEPLLAFEDTMSSLAGAWMSSGDRYYADCLVDILEQWAKANALYDFDFDASRPQAWYAIESMIFSAALALSTVTGEIGIAPERRKLISGWLVRTARQHFNTPGTQPSCCNNHYYRRSLYMTIIGVVADNDELFETGLRAVYSALEDMNEQGALELAMRRGWRAIHYQNYSLLYVVTIMQVAHRQGYDLFNLEKNGVGFHDAVDFLLRGLKNPYGISTLPPGEQDLSFTNDPQYFSWMEIWLAHFDDPRMEDFVRVYRPIYNRGAGGYVTLYFKQPEGPQGVVVESIPDPNSLKTRMAASGVRYPLLEEWRNSQ